MSDFKVGNWDNYEMILKENGDLVWYKNRQFHGTYAKFKLLSEHDIKAALKPKFILQEPEVYG